MIALLLLLALAADAPLGPYARPGIPVALRAAPGDYALDGWPVRVGRGGSALAAAPRLPCAFRDAANAELLRFEAPPEGRPLVALVGDAPADFEARLPEAAVVRLARAGLPLEWRCYDLFDRIYWLCDLDEGMRGVLGDWVRMGGSLALLGDSAPEPGAGERFLARDLESLLRAAGAPRASAIPRPRAIRPDLYELLAPAAPSHAASSTARRLATSFAAAAAILLLLAWRRRLSARILPAPLVLACAAAVAAGLLFPARQFRPFARGRIEEVLPGGRTRLYDVLVSLGREVPADPPPGAVPILFAAASAAQPWGAAVPPRAARIWLVGERTGGGEVGTFAAPGSDPGVPPLLARIAAPEARRESGQD